MPFEYGDERIVLIEVDSIPETDVIPWEDDEDGPGLKSRLEQEASDFLAAVMGHQMPPGTGRLYLPVLETDAKREVLVQTAAPILLPAEIDKLMGDRPRLELTSNELVRELPGDWPSSRKMGRILRTAQKSLNSDYGINLILESDRPGKKGGHVFTRSIA